MPPQAPIANEDSVPTAHKSGAGPLVAIIIILLLLIVGAVYFFNAHLHAQAARNQLPLIPASDSSTTIVSTTTLQ